MSLPQTACPNPFRKNVMPSVAIRSATASWLTSGRNTRRSTTNASATMMATAAIIATHTGIFSARRATASAANSTIAPCAKLNTPDALKISTKPSATSEYNTPASSPPISTSMKKPMLASVRDAQIGVDDFLVCAHVVGQAVGDLAPVFEHDDAVGDVHHHTHVV